MPNTNDQSTETEPAPITDHDFKAAQRRAFEAVGVTFESRYVDLDSPRVRIHVIETGDPSGEPPLLFVHGVMGFGAMFAPLIGRLKGVRMLAMDRPGWGLSSDF